MIMYFESLWFKMGIKSLQIKNEILILTPERPGIEILIKNIFGDLFVTIYI